jgi:hypothetical protein
MPELGLVIDESKRILSVYLPEKTKTPSIVQNLTFHKKLDQLRAVTDNRGVLTHRIYEPEQEHVWDVIAIMNGGDWTYQLVGYPSGTAPPVMYDYDMRED